MIVRAPTNSPGNGDVVIESQLGKIQRRLRLGLFATNPPPITDKGLGRPTRTDSNTLTKAGVGVLVKKPSAVPVQAHRPASANLPQAPSGEASNPVEVQPTPSSSKQEATPDLGCSTEEANSQPHSNCVGVSSEPPPKPLAECSSAISRKPSQVHSIAPTEAASKKAESPLITETISTVPRAMSTASRKSDRTAERQARLRPPKSQPASEDGRMSVASKSSKSSSSRRTAPVEPASMWPISDSFLPRAKPPPPLKIPTKHQRNRSVPASLPSPTLPTCQQSSQTNPRPKVVEPMSFFPVPDMSLPTPPLPSFFRSSRPPSVVRSPTPKKNSASAPPPSASSSHQAPSNQSSMHSRDTSILTRTDSRVTATSAESEASFTPSKFSSAWTWTPPASWSGPPPEGLQETDEGGGSSARARLTRKTSKGKLNGSKPLYGRVNVSSPSLWKSVSPRLAEEGTPEEPSLGEDATEAPDVVVKMQGFEGDAWHERAMAEVIPQLRALKSTR